MSLKVKVMSTGTKGKFAVSSSCCGMFKGDFFFAPPPVTAVRKPQR